MSIRTYLPSDQARVTALTIETFRPFYEEHVHPCYGDRLFAHQHGAWRQDYRDLVPTLHDPRADKFVAVYELDHAVAGFIGWHVDRPARHGMIEILAVDTSLRRRSVAGRLCEHALDAMRALGAEVAGVFTGGDDFHASARALYERLGGLRVDIAGYLIDLDADRPG